MDVNKKFNDRKESPVWNTSFPLNPSDWERFRRSGPLDFDDEREMSFYIHVPFCKQICTFCEYSRVICPDAMTQRDYLLKIQKDITSFCEKNSGIILRGFDIGGGTPTSISEDNFFLLMDIFANTVDRLPTSTDFEPSFEGSFDTLAEGKIRSAVSAGMSRLSLGIQTTDKNVLHCHHRKRISTLAMANWLEKIRKMGVRKINLDLMYGLYGQDSATIEEDLKAIRLLCPNQVTLYELRTNMIPVKDIPGKDALYFQYQSYYSGLIAMGYKGRFGQNTFSKDNGDLGVSSYIRTRMMDGIPYKGFGISAQSMNRYGISYNIGKGTGTILSSIQSDSFREEYTYILPPDQVASKYIAISAYNGSFSLARASELLGEDANAYFKEEIDFCLSNGLMSLENGRLFITKEGFKYYGAVFSLFYSK